LAFEKPVWFSEDIVIRRGYDLIEKFQPVEEICKTGKWNANGFTPAEAAELKCRIDDVTAGNATTHDIIEV